MQHPDQKYIEALLNNDEVILDELYQKFSGKIKWMVLQNNGTEEDAADIFQDALISIYHKAKNQNFTLTCPLEAFLYIVCRNTWLSQLSRKKSGPVTMTDIGVYTIAEDSFKLAEECMQSQGRRDLLYEKLSELGESCRQLLHLSWKGKPMDEIAQMLNVTYGYARKKKSECMAKLIVLIKQSSKYQSLKW